MAVRVHAEAPWLLPLTAREVGEALSVMLRQAGVSPDVEARLVRDGVMARENARHMGRLGPTNVLSFPADGGMPGMLLLASDTLLRECLLYGQEPAAHLLRLLAHALGHVLGLDHGPAMDALCLRMRRAALEHFQNERASGAAHRLKT